MRTTRWPISSTRALPFTHFSGRYPTQVEYNIVGTLLYSYTLSQYWCSDGTNITDATYPGDSYQTGLFWSLYKEAHGLTSLTDTQGVSTGVWRFNSPFNIYCKSGRNVIYFYGNGQASFSYDNNHYFGC